MRKFKSLLYILSIPFIGSLALVSCSSEEGCDCEDLPSNDGACTYKTLDGATICYETPYYADSEIDKIACEKNKETNVRWIDKCPAGALRTCGWTVGDIFYNYNAYDKSFNDCAEIYAKASSYRGVCIKDAGGGHSACYEYSSNPYTPTECKKNGIEWEWQDACPEGYAKKCKAGQEDGYYVYYYGPNWADCE
jgi:hypothetical protein